MWLMRQTRNLLILNGRMASTTCVKPLIAVVQMTATPDKAATFAQLTSLVERARGRGALMTFVPECADYVSDSREQAVAQAETMEGPTVTNYKELAKNNSMWLSVGGFHEKPETAEAGKKVFNTHIIIDNEGSIRGIYRKVHLFDVDVPGGVPAYESAYTLAGSQIGPPINTPCGMVGMAICYDMRFPELAIALADQGAQILTYPSAFTVPTGMAHWDVLLRNRAIENQCYVIAAAQVGRHHAKRSSYGNAMVVDPWGTVVARCHDTVDICLAEIDLDLLARRRREMPVRQHKRHDLYGPVTMTAPPSAAAAADSQSTYQFGPHIVSSSSAFYRSALSVAFVNRKPVLPGHVLVCSLRQAERLSDLSSAETADLFNAVRIVCDAVKKRYAASSLTVAVQDGPDAGQTVKHVHVHILPRRPGDFGNNDDIYEKLEKHDKNVAEHQWRTEAEMAEDAAVMRTFFTK